MQLEEKSMNKKILFHSGIVSVITLLLYFLLRYCIYPHAIFEVQVSFMLFAAVSAVANNARWIDVYGHSHPGQNEWRPHFAEDSPDSNALCFNAFKWGVSMFLFVFL